MKRKLMFINTVDITKNIETLLPPLGLGYLTSSLKNKFGSDQIEVRVVDRNIEKEIDAYQPDIVGITSVSQNYNRAIEYAGIAKQFNLPVIMGGVHISALPSTLSRNMDIGVIGEGEETIVELFNLFLDKGHFDKEELAKLDGIVFRRKGEIVITKKRSPQKPLDAIAMPARYLFEIKKSTYMFTSRGCPYDCTFCVSCRFWDSFRYFSAEYVVNEIKSLIDEYDVKYISFWDDLFVANRKRLKKIIELLEKDGILGKVIFNCNVRSNLVDEELVLLLKKLNVKSIGMGLESASPKTLDYLKGDNISIKDHVNAITVLRKHGIRPHASFIIGSPQEDEDDILQTLSFIKESQLNSFDIYVLTPLPGTPVWDYAKSRGLVNENMDWETLNVNFGVTHDKAIIVSEKLTREQIYKMFLRFAKLKRRMTITNAFANPKSSLKTFIKLLFNKLLIGRQ